MGDLISAQMVLDGVFSLLNEVGIRRISNTGFWNVDDDFLGWVGLNIGRHGKFLRINPFVGIHAIDVMKSISLLDGVKYRRGRYATIAYPLGDFLPEERQFIFGEGFDFDGDCKRLANSVASVRGGVADLATYERLSNELEKLVRLQGGFPEKYALVLHLGGRSAEAISFVKDQIEGALKNNEGEFYESMSKLLKIVEGGG